jgi:hypothetical protein
MDEARTENPAEDVAARSEDDSAPATLQASQDAERATAERLRQVLLNSEPALEPSMVTGSTIAEVEATFAAARAVLTKLREVVASETAGRIPVGAPGRAKSTSRSPFEKIRGGLADHH